VTVWFLGQAQGKKDSFIAAKDINCKYFPTLSFKQRHLSRIDVLFNKSLRFPHIFSR